MDDEFVEDANMPRDRVHGKMKGLFGSDYKFHSKEQEEGVMAVLDGISPLMIVLPTGGGKTLMIQLPALLDRDDKTTVVVTPLVALGDQLVERMVELNIDCVKWNRVWTRKAKVVVVVAETTLTTDFRCFLAGLDRSKELARVVYDEAHKLVMDVGYRPKLAEMKSIALSVQQVFLSATFPPSMKAEFEEMQMTPGLIVIRARTNRPRFRYEVRHVKDAEAEAVEWVKSRLKDGGDGKVLLFCTSKQRCDRLSEQLCCGKYYSTARDKTADLKKWEAGESRVLVATGALGAGVDVSKVVDVIHVGKPWTYKDFSQESGRGGRANETVRSVTFIESWELKRGGEEKTLDGMTLCEYLTTKGCRRRPGSRFLDGQDQEITCEDIDGERCDNCRAEYLKTPDGKRRLSEEEMVKGENKRRKTYDERVLAVRQDVQNCAYKQMYVEQTLDRLQRSCPACWLYEGWSGSDHTFEDCEVLTSLLGMRYSDVRKGIKYWDKFGCCYDCSRPCDWCEDFTSQRKCGFKDVIVPTVLAAFVSQDMRWFKCIEAVERCDFKDVGEFVK
jgi:superfamily II DNA helicase RecQ